MYFFMNILIHVSLSLLINQLLTLVIISIWFKEREAFIIDILCGLFLFHPLQTIEFGGVKILFLSWKKLSTSHIMMLNRIGVFSLELLEKANENLL